jgi:hypothetical protein
MFIGVVAQKNISVDLYCLGIPGFRLGHAFSSRRRSDCTDQTLEGYISKDIYIVSYIQKSPKGYHFLERNMLGEIIS